MGTVVPSAVVHEDITFLCVKKQNSCISVARSCERNKEVGL